MVNNQKRKIHIFNGGRGEELLLIINNFKHFHRSIKIIIKLLVRQVRYLNFSLTIIKLMFKYMCTISNGAI